MPSASIISYHIVSAKKQELYKKKSQPHILGEGYSSDAEDITHDYKDQVPCTELLVLLHCGLPKSWNLDLIFSPVRDPHRLRRTLLDIFNGVTLFFFTPSYEVIIHMKLIYKMNYMLS